MIARSIKILALTSAAALALPELSAEVPRSGSRIPARPRPQMKTANQLIHRQEPINVSPRLLEQVTPDNSRVRVSLSKQRAYLLMGDEVVICVTGEITLIQEVAGGTASVTLRAGDYAINPRGVWHTADTADHATAPFITAGMGTEHRPR